MSIVLNNINTKESKKEKAQMHVLASGALILFETDQIQKVKSKLNQIDYEDFANIKSRKEFDLWFDQKLNWLHYEIADCYRFDNNHVYSETAKFFSEYLSILSIMHSPTLAEFIHQFNIQHPIMNDDYEIFTDDLYMNGAGIINRKEDYYMLVRNFRKFIDENSLNEYTLRILISFDKVHKYLPLSAQAIVSKLAYIRNSTGELPKYLRTEKIENPRWYHLL